MATSKMNKQRVCSSDYSLVNLNFISESDNNPEISFVLPNGDLYIIQFQDSGIRFRKRINGTWTTVWSK